MSKFGWSLPPGCGTLPGEEEQAIDLAEDQTLKGYGRRGHGLCGKDADLDEGGQVIVNEAWWFECGTIKVSGYAYASICPEDSDEFGNEYEYDEYMNVMQEVVSGCGYPGEWSDDYWVLRLDYELKCDFEWDDTKSDEENTEAATRRAYDLITEDKEIEDFQTEMEYCSNAMSKEKWDAFKANPDM
jgi:hypothetical protein